MYSSCSCYELCLLQLVILKRKRKKILQVLFSNLVWFGSLPTKQCTVEERKVWTYLIIYFHYTVFPTLWNNSEVIKTMKPFQLTSIFHICRHYLLLCTKLISSRILSVKSFVCLVGWFLFCFFSLQIDWQKDCVQGLKLLGGCCKITSVRCQFEYQLNSVVWGIKPQGNRPCQQQAHSFTVYKQKYRTQSRLTKITQNSTTVFASYFAFPHNFYELKSSLLMFTSLLTFASGGILCLFFVITFYNYKLQAGIYMLHTVAFVYVQNIVILIITGNVSNSKLPSVFQLFLSAKLFSVLKYLLLLTLN